MNKHLYSNHLDVLEYIRSLDVQDDHVFLIQVIDRSKSSSNRKKLLKHWLFSKGEAMEFVSKAINYVKSRMMEVDPSNPDKDIRAYIDLSPKNKEQIHRMVMQENIYNPEFILHPSSYIVSAACRARSIKPKIMLDIDSLDVVNEVDEILNEHNVHVDAKINSKKGMHYIMDKFDFRILSGIQDVEYKRQANTLLAYYILGVR